MMYNTSRFKTVTLLSTFICAIDFPTRKYILTTSKYRI